MEEEARAQTEVFLNLRWVFPFNGRREAKDSQRIRELLHGVPVDLQNQREDS